MSLIVQKIKKGPQTGFPSLWAFLKTTLFLFVKHRLKFFEKISALLIASVFYTLVEFLQDVFLFLAQIAGNFHRYPDILVTAASAAQNRNTLTLEFEHIAGLGAFMYLIADLTIQRGNGNLSAQSCLCKGDRHFTPNVIAPALKQSMGTNGYVNMQITVGTTVAACIAMSRDIQHLLVVNAGGDGDFHGFLAANPSGAVTVLTRGRNHLAGAMTAVTPTGGLYHTKGRALADAYLSGTAALGAGLRLGALGSATAAAALTGFNLPVSDFLFAALGSFFKRNCYHSSLYHRRGAERWGWHGERRRQIHRRRSCRKYRRNPRPCRR